MIAIEKDTTPILAFVENERSATLIKFVVVMPDGKKKEYTLKATKDGKLILN